MPDNEEQEQESTESTETEPALDSEGMGDTEPESEGGES